MDVLAKDATSTSKMSMLQIIDFVSQPLPVINLNGYAVPKEGNTEAILNIHFLYTSAIPKSLTFADPLINNSEIRLYFVGIGSVFIKNDLGFGFLVPTAIPCRSTNGLIATTGQTITCTLYPSTKPYIQVTNYNLVNANTAIRILIPKITTPVDDFTVVIKILTSLNGVYNELANGNQVIALNPDANIGTRI